MIVLILSLSACSDYTLGGVDSMKGGGAVKEDNCADTLDNDGDGLTDEEDPDCQDNGGVGPKPSSEKTCYDMTEYGSYTPGLLWSDADAACHGFLPPPFFDGDLYVTEAEIWGSGAEPDSGMPVRVVEVVSDEYPSEENLPSADVYVDGHVGDTWHATITPGDVNAWQVGAGLEWFPAIEIQDYDRPLTNACGEYEILQFCPTLESASADRRVPDTTTCEAGSGTFRLLPSRLIDHDEDGDYAAVFEAIMVSGTGTPTNAAWIRSASVTSGSALGFRVVKKNRGFGFNPSDALVDPTVVSLGVGSGTANFNAGVISGGAPWVLSETDGATSMDPTVDLTWECATPAQQESVSPALGFMFTLAGLDCSVSWPQRFVIRPRPTFAPTEIQIQMYGDAAFNRHYPVEDLNNGHYRIFGTFDGFSIDATIEDIDANQGMVLDIDLLQLGGDAVCAPGTYTLAAEE